jgi:hypothetical protein
MLERLIDAKQWSKKQETEISSQESFLDSLRQQKKNLFLKSEIERLKGEIKSAEIKLLELKNARASLFGRTAESCADERVNDFYIQKCLYNDPQLKTRSFNIEELDEVDDSKINEISQKYSLVYSELTDENIQKIVLEDFFNMYMPFVENCMDFYGMPATQLTYNQLKILVYGRFYKNIFSQHPNIPEDIKDDPEKILEYINATENAKKMMEKKGQKDNGGESIVGATKEDLEYLGIKGKREKTVSLHDEIKKKGGSLSMEDMMKIF